MTRLLLCTDLDRTLIPNGAAEESALARKWFSTLAADSRVTLVYVTGRHRELVEQAIEEYQLPKADYVISDVGSSIYQVTAADWLYLSAWEKRISSDWRGKSADDLQALFDDIKDIRLQEASKQNTHKLSYYAPLDSDHEKIVSIMGRRLVQQGIAASLVWSIDQQAGTGLLDVLPASAGKRQAIEFLMAELGFDISSTLFAGDSGNDLSVLASPIPSVLVANADEQTRLAAINQVALNQRPQSLYLARGHYMGMNGNYSAGILEGVAHYLPEAEQWFRVDS